MKNLLPKLTMLISISIAIVLTSSCSKEDENEQASNDLLGTWTFGQSSVDLSVGSVDLVDYMVANFEYTQQEAEIMVSFFTTAMQSANQGTITFNENGNYQLVNSDGTENGTWSIDNDGNTLTLVYEGETDNISIISLSASSMKLGIPTETAEIDLDGDDENETTVNIDSELNLSK